MIKMSEIETRVLDYIEEHTDEMVRFIRDLVRIDTQVPPGLNYDLICDILAEKLTGLGCDVCIHDAPEKYMELSGAKFMGLEGPRSNVVARYPGKSGKPVLHISAHIDTAAI